MGRKTKRRSLIKSNREKRKGRSRLKVAKRMSKNKAVRKKAIVRKLIERRRKQKEKKAAKKQKNERT